MTYLPLELAGILLLLLFSAFFSSAEVAFFSLDRVQVDRMLAKHPTRGRLVELILSSPTRLLSTILIGNTLVNIGISTGILHICVKILGASGEIYAIAVSLLVLVVFGEVGPKRLAVNHPDRTALIYAPLLEVMILLLTPLRVGLELITRTFRHFFQPRGHIFSGEEFTTAVEISHEHGVLDANEQAMVKGILRLESLKASDIMIPRVDIVGIDLEDTPPDVVDFVRNARVRELPIFQHQLDEIAGFLDTQKFLLNPGTSIRKAWIPPYFVPETAPANKLLRFMIADKRTTAVVVDEYGGTAGLVTIGDILEEIVGDLARERQDKDLLFEESRPGTWIMDGSINLETVSEKLGVEFSDEGVDRISGWFAARLERLPHNGDTVEWSGFRFEVRQMRKHRVQLAAAIRLSQEQDAEEES